jgi:hypothetical protein
MHVIYTSKGMSKKFGVRIIYTSKGMSKKFGARIILRCALSTGKYGISKNQARKEYPTYNKKRKANWIGIILHRNYL